MNARLSDAERQALATCIRLHRAARATLVDGAVRWICEGCGQPLAPSDPLAAFDDLTIHQTVMLDDLIEGFFAARPIAPFRPEADPQPTSGPSDQTAKEQR